MGRRSTLLKPTTTYVIYFYYPKGCKDIEDYESFDTEKQAIKSFLKYKNKYPDYDLKLIKETTTYEEVKIEV